MKSADTRKGNRPRLFPAGIALAVGLFMAGLTTQAAASIAYGSLNNFDTVNDTGKEAHGFEIELDDCRSTDITYTYDYNHYGAPQITEDTALPGHPRCVIRWASRRHADGSWAAYTAIPAGPIAPTDGHLFTDPTVNFGGEHFGVGYRTPPSAVRYHWLVDNGSGQLVNGGDVQVATPVFTYAPAAAGIPAQVQAIIAPPPPPEVPVREFGTPVWVREIRTTSHNNQAVKLRDLVSEDPDDPERRDWRNGEPDEVEVEWQLLQTEFSKVDGGANGELAAAPEDLENGDEVVTRRYEFFTYLGPIDAETGEAMADRVADDGIHGTGMIEVNGVVLDLAATEVVGEFKGSQMAALHAEAEVGLIDHLNEAEAGTPYTPRTIVIQGSEPFTAAFSGTLPQGMAFDAISGILAGTPREAGEFEFRIRAADAITPEKEKSYHLSVAAPGEELPARFLLDTAAEPAAGGTTTGSGSYAAGMETVITATAAPGYRFVDWQDNGRTISVSAVHTVTMNVHQSLVARFVPLIPVWTVQVVASPAMGGTVTGHGSFDDGSSVTVTAVAGPGYAFSHWKEADQSVSVLPAFSFIIAADRVLTAVFTPSVGSRTISLSASPSSGGSVTGAGNYLDGASCTVTAVPAEGYQFKRWLENGISVSTRNPFLFTVSGNRTLTAKFVRIYPVTTESLPAHGGTTATAGSFEDGDRVTVTASAVPGFRFMHWTENGLVVSMDAVYEFKANPARHLTAVFLPELPVIPVLTATSVDGWVHLTWTTDDSRWVLQESNQLDPAAWEASQADLREDHGFWEALVPADASRRFFRLALDP